MNLGRRIDKCLEELGWRQVDLLARVPDLEPATLSALIKRDSKWSDHAIAIAEALGVHLHWLLSGVGPKWLSQKTEDDFITRKVSRKINATVDLLEGLDPDDLRTAHTVIDALEAKKHAKNPTGNDG